MLLLLTRPQHARGPIGRSRGGKPANRAITRREARESTAASAARSDGRSFGSPRPTRGRLPAPRARSTSTPRGVPSRDHAEEDAAGENPASRVCQDGRRCRGSRAYGPHAGQSGGCAAGAGIDRRVGLRTRQSPFRFRGPSRGRFSAPRARLTAARRGWPSHVVEARLTFPRGHVRTRRATRTTKEFSLHVAVQQIDVFCTLSTANTMKTGLTNLMGCRTRRSRAEPSCNRAPGQARLRFGACHPRAPRGAVSALTLASCGTPWRDSRGG
jgi:hypothetical protein